MLFSGAVATVAMTAVSEGTKKATMYFAGGVVAGAVAYKVGDVAYNEFLKHKIKKTGEEAKAEATENVEGAEEPKAEEAPNEEPKAEEETTK
jgi:hypothetical protein